MLKARKIPHLKYFGYIFYISSSCCATSTDFPDPLLPFVSIVHRSQASLPGYILYRHIVVVVDKLKLVVQCGGKLARLILMI